MTNLPPHFGSPRSSQSVGQSLAVIPTLTMGDIVSTGFRLYRSNFRTYFILALRATLWLLVPFLVLLGLGVVTGLLYDRFSSGMGVLMGIAVAIILLRLSMQSLIRAFLDMALIIRLAYEDFTHVEPTPPTAIGEIRQTLKPRGRRILLTFIFSFFLLFSLNLLLSVANVPLTNTFGLLFQTWNGEWLAFLLANLITFSLYTWISARFFLVEVPIVIEENLSAFQSIGRSWSLAQGSILRILIVMTIAFLVTIPLYSIASVPPIVGLVAAIPSFNLSDEAGQMALLTRFLPGVAIGLLLFLVMNMMVMGFWQSIKAVLYYDLRSRREGFDLRLSDRRE